MNDSLCMASLHVKAFAAMQSLTKTTNFESKIMGLFKPDFFRSLAFGFLIGAAGMAMSVGATAWASADTTEQATR